MSISTRRESCSGCKIDIQVSREKEYDQSLCERCIEVCEANREFYLELLAESGEEVG